MPSRRWARCSDLCDLGGAMAERLEPAEFLSVHVDPFAGRLAFMAAYSLRQFERSDMGSDMEGSAMRSSLIT